MLRRVAMGLAVATALLATAMPAWGQTSQDKQRQADAITDDIERLGELAANLGEQYNSAVVAFQKADTAVKDGEAKLATLEGQLSTVRSSAGTFAVKAYVYADQMGGLASLLSGTSTEDGSAQREGYASVALGNTSEVKDGVNATIEDVNRQKAILEADRAQKDKLAKVTAERKQAAESAQASQQQVLVKVKADLAALVQQEQQRRREAEAAAAKAEAQRAQAALLAAQTRKQAAPVAVAAPAATNNSNSGSSGSSGSSGGSGSGGGQAAAAPKPTAAPAPTPDIPSTSPGAATAVRAALGQLGVPYRFAGASPGVAFDCSGLTMWAWAQAGVSMPHGSRDQFAMFPKVPQSDLQPGDLVFFNGSNGPLGHVGMYIGNGQMVQAPRTGDVVKISSISGRNYAGAVRP